MRKGEREKNESKTHGSKNIDNGNIKARVVGEWLALGDGWRARDACLEGVAQLYRSTSAISCRHGSITVGCTATCSWHRGSVALLTLPFPSDPRPAHLRSSCDQISCTAPPWHAMHETVNQGVGETLIVLRCTITLTGPLFCTTQSRVSQDTKVFSSLCKSERWFAYLLMTKQREASHSPLSLVPILIPGTLNTGRVKHFLMKYLIKIPGEPFWKFHSGVRRLGFCRTFHNPVIRKGRHCRWFKIGFWGVLHYLRGKLSWNFNINVHSCNN